MTAQPKQSPHKCYRCRPHDGTGPFRQTDGEGPELESVETTFSEAEGEVTFTAGYSAREIAQNRARQTGGQVYVNEVSPNIRRRGASGSVEYAVATSAVYTLCAPDACHDHVYRAYWRPLS